MAYSGTPSRTFAPLSRKVCLQMPFTEFFGFCRLAL